MVVITKGEIHDRGEGFLVYAKGMNASMKEKARILPYVKPGIIVEMGCGNGAVLELLSGAYPKSFCVGVDISDTMLGMAKQRTKSPVVKADVTKPPFADNRIDTMIFCSILHEVYSYNSYDRAAVSSTLANAYHALKPDGRLIIRDGVKPQEDIVHMAFKNPETERKFLRFANDFGPYRITFKEEDGIVVLRRPDAMEFLSKYFYDKNWDIEVKEQFGVYTLEEYRELLEKTGFGIVHAESYLIEWLRTTHYEKDAELLKKVEGKLVPQEYPHSTMILIAEKPGLCTFPKEMSTKGS